MADPADPIKAAVETLQRALKEHGDYEGPVDGTLSPELYESITNFAADLKEIEGVARIVNQGDEPIEGIYDPALGQAMLDYFASPAFLATRASAMTGEMEVVKQLLRSLAIPQEYIDNPQGLFQLVDQDLASVVGALNTLDEAGRLERAPNELTPEQIAAQPAAIEAMETLIKEDLEYYRDTSKALLEEAQTAMDALPDDATDEDRAALQGQLDTANKAVTLLESGLEHINDLDPDQNPDPNFEEALRVYVEFLQHGNNATAYVEQMPEAGQVLDLSKVVDGSGGYSEEYRTFLKDRMESFEEYYEDLESKGDERTAEEEFAFQIIGRTNNFNGAMDAMIESGAYVPPEPGEPPRETLPLEQARPIIEEAIDYMVRKGKIEFEPVLNEGDDPEFDLDSRMAIQAFLIDLKGFLDIDVDDEAGLYSQALHEALSEKLADETIRKRVADEYFKGNEEMVAQLLPALNTYDTEFPVTDDLGFPYSISDDVLITMPQLKEVEVDMMVTAIARAPDDELLAMNELMASLTGYGMEDFMPEGALTEEQINRLELGGDRSELLGDLYLKVKQEAIDAIARDGRPISDLEEEIQERMVERFNNFVEDNAAFDVIRAEYMRGYIREGVSAALAAEQAIEGGPHVEREAGKAAFTSSIPDAIEFGTRHGPNMRAYFLIDPETVEGVTPEVMRNFGGDIEKTTLSMDEALSAPTMGALVSDMTEDFGRLGFSEIAQRTIREVRSAIVEKEEMLESIYNDPRNAEFIGENGEMVVRSLNGETVLLTQRAEGFEARYLDASGIGAIEGLDESKILNVGEEFDLDALLIKTAMAGYQSINDGAEWKSTHNPEFFELGGRHFVVGMDKDTNTIKVVEMDEDFLSASNAARRVYSVASPIGRADTLADFMKDPAYRFLQENYARQFSSPGSADRMFQFMLQQVDTEEAALALSIMGEYSLIDFENLATLEDAPIVEQSNILTGIFMVNGARPEEDQMQPFIYLREGDDGSQNIFVVTPALKEEIVIADDGTETTSVVLDTGAPPMVRDISDPRLYQSMRDLFTELDVVPGDALANDPAFAELREWIQTGGRPPLKEPPEPEPVYAAPTEESIKSLFDSAAGFDVQGRDITFGAPITDVNVLVDVLGYDPNQAFLNNALHSPELSYVVHGMEPDIWTGSEDHNDFLNDHVLITFMQEGEVVTVAMSKDVVANNPMRVGEMIKMEHEFERELNNDPISSPSVFAANRDGITTSAEGVQVPVVDIDHFLNMDPPGQVEREVNLGTEEHPQMVIQKFSEDQEYWDQRQEWRQDYILWKRAIEAEESQDGARVDPDPETPVAGPAGEEVELSNADMLAECINEITCDRTAAVSLDDTALSPALIRPDA